MRTAAEWLLIAILSWSLTTPGSAAEPTPSGLEDIFDVRWTITAGMNAPESIYHHAATNDLFLSQIGGGGGDEKDGNGFISRLSLDGKLLDEQWVTGLNAPKGLRSHGDMLWVSDIDRLVGIHIPEAKIVVDQPVAMAKFLNDVACGADGAVYVTDLAASRIYRLLDQEVTLFAEGPQLEHANGVLVEGDALILGGWGPRLNEDFSTNEPGHLLRLDLKTKAVTPITRQRTGHLDGVESDGHGGYYVSDWRAGRLFHISAEGESQLLVERPRGAADIAYLADQNLLILPEMIENRLTAFVVTPAEEQ